MANNRFVEDVFAKFPCPGFTLQDIELLPLIELTLGGDVPRNQAGEFIRVERRRTRRVVEIDRHAWLILAPQLAPGTFEQIVGKGTCLANDGVFRRGLRFERHGVRDRAHARLGQSGGACIEGVGQ